MKLYHFTARHHLVGSSRHGGPGIRVHGIVPNPLGHPLIALPPMVWLTEDGSWDQMWSSRPVPRVGCDRTEVRIEVVIPKTAQERLLTYDRIRPFVQPDWREDFEGGYDLSPWRAFVGRIPPSWIRGESFREGAA